MKNTKYTSEATNFLNTLFKKPGNYEERLNLRNTWWDKGSINLDEQESYEKAEVKSEAYPYFSYPTDKK